jgi:hypothetical protein
VCARCPAASIALAAAVVNLPVLLHGVVLSALPSTVARATVALTVWSGAAATVLGLVVYERVLNRDQ